MTSIALAPTRLGPLALANHIVMAPMTRGRSPGTVPTALVAEYYRQRATAGLIVTEGTAPAADGVGYTRIPGLYDARHVTGWRQVTDAVHAEGGRIFVQLMHCGRLAHPLNLPDGAEIVAPSAVAAAGKMWTDQAQLQDMPVPRALGTEEVPAVVRQYARRPSWPWRRASTASSCTARTATCRSSSSTRRPTGAPTRTAAASSTAPGS
jgi:N-ethylmaleimide reductase